MFDSLLTKMFSVSSVKRKNKRALVVERFDYLFATTKFVGTILATSPNSIPGMIYMPTLEPSASREEHRQLSCGIVVT